MIKKVWFPDLEILEILQKIYRETHQPATNTVTESLNTEQPETSNENQMVGINDWNSAHANTTTQEEKMNVEILNRIISEKKTTLLLPGTKTGEQSSRKPKK